MSAKIIDYIFPMPKLTPEGFRINIIQLFDPDSFTTLDYSRYIITQNDYKLFKDCLVAGDIVLCDLGMFKPIYYAKLFDMTCLKLMKVFFTHYPFQPKHVLVINCHPVLQKGIALCKTLVPKKIADRISVISVQNLTDYIQAEYLPEDYGGTQKSLEYLKEAWIKEFVKEKDLLVGIGEAKPTGPIPKEFQAYEDEFGIDGSFRKLNID